MSCKQTEGVRGWEWVCEGRGEVRRRMPATYQQSVFQLIRSHPGHMITSRPSPCGGSGRLAVQY